MVKKILNRVWNSKVICILFHSRIKIKEFPYEIDPMTQRPYGRYKCKICGRRYLANNRFDWYQIDIKKKKNKKK